jgi:hypothetical protein
MDVHRAARYTGRPVLILLENYAMAVIGQLPPEHENKVAATVAARLGGEASQWQLTLKQASGLPLDFDDRILALWRMQNPGTNPADFVMAVSDSTFLPLIDPG